MNELRWHPFRQQWVVNATHRQNRTYHPPADFCPLCPTAPGAFETEIPAATYEIAVFQNRFPAFNPNLDPVTLPENPDLLAPYPAAGHCEVICYSQDHETALSTLPLDQLRKLTRVWADRTAELSREPGIAYVYIFENRGPEVGVTLSHPHGQIYATPFIPPVLATELEAASQHRARTGRSLMADWLDAERKAELRILFENDSFLVLCPYFARNPYEVHIVAREPFADLREFNPRLFDDLAVALHRLVRAYDALFERDFPYIMAIHQGPVQPHPEAWFHIEFYPPLRTPDKRKWLAGTEQGADLWSLDVTPEAAAEALRACLQ